jgi:16S rRNA pseudouridine516 synthase
VRLDKVLQSQGFGSRKDCRLLVNTGRVRVQGSLSDDPDAEVPLEGLSVEVDGTTWTCRERLYVALHKPVGFECSHAPTHHRSVFELVPPFFVARGVRTVGRLDADTTGLLLLSDDGAFIQQHTSPKRKVPKVYEVTCAEPVNDAQLEQLGRGVVLADDPVPTSGLAERVDSVRVRLTISEGRYHQVRRMLAAVGQHVTALHRVSVGALILPAELEPGAWRIIEPAQVAPGA